jgi:uncharacterized protein
MHKYIRVKIIPKSAKNEIVETMEDETIKIRIKAVPEKGKANKELIKFLSKEYKLSKENITIVSGKTEQIKLLRINGLN